MEQANTPKIETTKTGTDNLLMENRELRKLVGLLQENIGLKSILEQSSNTAEKIKPVVPELNHTEDGHRQLMDGPKQTMDGPEHNMDGPKHDMDGPKHNMDGLKNDMDGPKQNMDGPKHNTDGPKHDMEGPKKNVDGPKQDMDGPKHDMDGPKHDVDGPKQNLDGPKHDVDGTKQDMDGTKHDLNGPKPTIDDLKQNMDDSRNPMNDSSLPMKGSKHDTDNSKQNLERPKTQKGGPKHQVDGEKNGELEIHPLQNSSQLRHMQRIVGEIAFQLDRRILAWIFHDQSRLYGVTVGNIPQKIKEAAISKKTGQVKEKKLADMTKRYEDIMTKLKQYGYDADLHPAFSEHIVNVYGIIKEHPSLDTPEMQNLSDPDHLKKIVYSTVPSYDLDNILILLKCLCKLSREDGKPVLIL
ncbi:uncharacterized protein LOC142157885 [Mixophyes fleayi]|uniref:uncharacterized protein LOC142157885 n=1 Tax=Mixophyes fleayi TaxID=3061075 RepID=UPI003F4DA795